MDQSDTERLANACGFGRRQENQEHFWLHQSDSAQSNDIFKRGLPLETLSTELVPTELKTKVQPGIKADGASL